MVKSLKAQKKQWPAATSIWALERDYRSVRAFPISEAAAEEYKVALRDVDPEFRSVQVKYRLPEGAAPDEDRIKAAAERHGAVVALSTFQVTAAEL